MIDDREVGDRLVVSMNPFTLVDGREVEQRGERSTHRVVQVRDRGDYLVSGHPDGGDVVEHPDYLGQHVDHVGGDHQTSSGDLSDSMDDLPRCLRSRMLGGSGRWTSCDPTTQLRGRRSFPTASRRSWSPSMNASGRGGHPGMYTSTGMNESTPWTTL